MPREDGTLTAGALEIPRAELRWRASRSSGPGGQHVNTSSTRVELVWDIATSPSVDDVTRHRLLTRLASRLDSRGRLRVVAQDERSQLRNRTAALERFVEIIADASRVPRRRRATRPSAAARMARRRAKERRSALKRERRRAGEE
jgi:ribosome-associated protein